MKPLRLAVSSPYDGMFVPVVKQACDAIGAQVVYWHGGTLAGAQSPAEAFPGALVHPVERNIIGSLPEGIAENELPLLDEPVLAAHASAALTFERLLEYYDPDGRAFTGRERRDLWHRALRFALHVVEHLKPDVFVSGTTPHSLMDFALYSVCRSRGVKVLVLTMVNLPGHLLFRDTLESGPRSVKRMYESKLASAPKPDSALSKRMEEYFSGVAGDYSAGRPWYSARRDGRLIAGALEEGRPPSIWPAIRFALGRLAWIARSFVSSPAAAWRHWFCEPALGMPKPRASWQFDPVPRHWYGQWRQLFALAAKHRHLRSYASLSRKPDFSRPYVFVALHYQPETSTSPLGSYYADQLLMLAILARTIPPGWSLYVKEHPAIFDPNLWGHAARDDHYYRQICALPNVTLVPLDCSPFDLIDRARAVATVTGTAAWEAVIRGKPAVVFGAPWFIDCEGILPVKSAQECRAAMAAIAGGKVPDAAKVRLYLSCVEACAVYADRNDHDHLTPMNHDQSVQALASYFASSLRDAG
jgi:Capsule polysaccharide biosynthesis protein